MPSRDIADLCAALQPLCREHLAQFNAQYATQGITAHVDCTYRSCEEQNDDYAKGRAAPGNIITNARGGQSAHNCLTPDGQPAARAYDIYIQKPDGSLDWDTGSLPWQQIGEIGESLGLTWGHRWHNPDTAHFQLDAKFP